jgi:hypothetical protein
MAIPTDYIFTPGTCLKKDFYGVLTAALLGAGWVNTSSLASSDYEVYTSTGNTGDKALILNLRPGSAGTPANSVVTTAYCQFSFRFPSTYVPGAAGVAGTFTNPDVWRDIFIAPVATVGQLAMDTTYNYKLYVDKSKIMFSIEFPPATGYSPMFVHLGMPDSTWCTETGNRGVFVAVSTQFTAGTAGNAVITDTPTGMGSSTTRYGIPIFTTLAPKNPNSDNKYALSDLYYGSATEGTRGKIDGVLAMPDGSTITGDTITLGAHQYYALNCHVLGVKSFPSSALAIRLA